MNRVDAPHLLLVISEDWYVVSHRLPLIRAAMEAGWRVTVATRIQQHAGIIEESGAEIIALPMAREGRHPIRELATIGELRRMYRSLAPDVVHHVGVKPVVYGGWAARHARVPGVVHAFAGMGTLYSDEQKASSLRLMVETFMRPVTKARRTRVIVQNDADAELLRSRKLAHPESIRIVRGSGVDLRLFAPRPEPIGPPLVVLPARMLTDKGVVEFVSAAEKLRADSPATRFALVGARDAANPSAISQATLHRWVNEGSVEWWQHRTDMAEVFAQATMVVLPSYREGMPKALLEAAASGKAIVTTDVPGCRDVVQHDLNGLLVRARDSHALADAIESLLKAPGRRREMGRQGRRRAEAEFGDAMLAKQTVAIYQELLS